MARGWSRVRYDSPKVIALWVLLPCIALGQSHAANAPDNFDWQLPPGFPQPWVPADNPMSAAKVALGRRLFNETRLSITGDVACVNCHRPELAFTDGRARAQGATGEPLKHAAMSLANVAYNATFTWSDASVDTLEAQMQLPLFNEHPVEMGLQKREDSVLATLAADKEYAAQFAAVFADDPDPISIKNLVRAIAAFERTLISGRSPFDRYVFDDERDALSPAAKRGMALFYSERVGCAACHFGLNFSGPLRDAEHADAAAIHANTGLYDVDGKGGYPDGDQGLIESTQQPADMGKFRAPTLRNIALTAPYMHDGSIQTLGEVIEHYAEGGRARHGRLDPNHGIDSRIQPFTLSAAEQRDLLAFLDALTDPKFVADPRFR